MTQEDAMPRSLGGRIRQARKRRRMTQVQLAAKAGIGQSALSSLETDDSRAPHAGTLLRLAAALEVDPYWLATGGGEAEPPKADADFAALFERLTRVNRHTVELLMRSMLADQAQPNDPPKPSRRPTRADPFPDVPVPVRKVRKTPA